MEMSLDPMGGAPLAQGAAVEDLVHSWWESYDPVDVRYGYYDGKLFYPKTLLERDRNTGAERKRTLVVRSDGRVLELIRSPLMRGGVDADPVCRLSDGTLVHDNLGASPFATWRVPSIRRFLNGAGPERDLACLISDVEGYIRSRVWLPREEDYVLLALVVPVSYAQEIFDAVPLFMVTGDADSGKSRLGAVMAALGANAPASAGIGSPEAIMRLIDECRGLVVLDDREDLRGRNGRTGMFSDFSQWLKVSYSKETASKVVYSMPSRRAERISLYGVKILNNTSGADRILGSRMFFIHAMQRSRDVLLAPRPNINTKNLRDEFHLWTFCNVAAISATYSDICRSVVHRRDEIAAPLRVFAELAGGEWPSRLEVALAECERAANTFAGSAEILAAAVRRLGGRGFGRVCPAHVLLEMRALAAENGANPDVMGGINEAWVGRLMRQMGLVDPDVPEERRRVFGHQVRILALPSGIGGDTAAPSSFCTTCTCCRYARFDCPIRNTRRRNSSRRGGRRSR